MNLGNEFAKAFARGLGTRLAWTISPASFAWAVIFMGALLLLGMCAG